MSVIPIKYAYTKPKNKQYLLSKRYGRYPSLVINDDWKLIGKNKYIISTKIDQTNTIPFTG